MESLTIEILNPKVKKLLQNLADLNLIVISPDFSSQHDDEQQWSNLSKEQQQGVFDAVESIESGKGIPHDEVISEFKKKLIND
jgi:hypothetical protein